MPKIKTLSEEKKALLIEAQIYCDVNDKSTEFMIQYIQDVANVSHDTVIKYLTSKQNGKN